MAARCILAPIALALLAAHAAADWHVWTVARTERVLQSDPPGKETAARLAAARNEWECFQVLVRSDEPVQGVSMEPSDLRGPDGAVLRAEKAHLYRQHQLHLTLPTYRNDGFQPGWYPDPLIPFRHPRTRKPLPEARFSAAPFDLPANQTHGFLVDLYIPRDAPPGVYRGTYRVTAAGREAVEIPVELTVWDFALPPVPAMQTALGSPARRLRDHVRQHAKEGTKAEPVDWSAVEKQCADLVSRHRINAYPPPDLLRPEKQPDGSYRIPADHVSQLRQWIDRYHVNAIQTPHPRSVVKDPVAQKHTLHRWLAAFDQMADALDRPHVTFFTYLRDEPNKEEEYRYVQTWGRAVTEADSVVKVLVVEQTWPQNPDWGDLYGAVDIWCALFPLCKPESAATRIAAGETVWCYTALCQRKPTPWWHIDFPLLHYRVPAWIAWQNGITGILYWGGMSFWKQAKDPWTHPITLDRRNQNEKHLWNGEGTLVYPGRDAGYPGIAPSLRLKALRDGLEDYDYFALCEAAQQGDAAREILRKLAPSWFQWETNPAAYQQARIALAKLIVSSKK